MNETEKRERLTELEREYQAVYRLTVEQADSGGGPSEAAAMLAADLAEEIVRLRKELRRC